MKALLFHTKRYASKLTSLANRPKNIKPEDPRGKENQSNKDCITALITVEKGDDETSVTNGIVEEIKKMCKETKRNNVVICPFAHLSNNLADSKKSLSILNKIEKNLKNEGLKVLRAHFGSNKSLLLDVYGHTGNARYREFK